MYQSNVSKYKGSSNVRSGTYNKKKQEMKITFKGNRQYVYSDVPEKTFKRLEKAPSKGRFVNSKIAYEYDYKRIK